MKNRVIAIRMFLIVFGFTSVFSQQNTQIEELKEVVVTATKFSIEKEKVGKIIYQINREQLDRFRGQNVIDVLHNLSGIVINAANSSASKNKSIYTRGGRDRQVLILIDGIPVNDPSGITTTFDLRLLSIHQIETIEVMNGASSTLYGTGAATGVINIILKKAQKSSFNASIETSVGTNNSQLDTHLKVNDFNQNVMISGMVDKFNYLTSFSSISNDGISEAFNEDEDDIFENDQFKAKHFLLKIGFKPTEKFNIEFFSNVDVNDYDFDAGSFNDDEINNANNAQLRLGSKAFVSTKLADLTLLTSITTTEREYKMFNSWTMETDEFDYEGNSVFVDFMARLQPYKNLDVLVGFNFQKHFNQTTNPYAKIDKDEANFTLADPYVNAIFEVQNFMLNVGLRMSTHTEYGSHVVYSLNPSYHFSKKLKLITSYSTAFIAPSPYQLYSQYGNVELKPEEDETFEIGFDYNKSSNFQASLVYFYRNELNSIILPDYIQYQNAIEKTNTKGVETQVKMQLNDDLDFNLMHSYTYKRNDIDYIPKNKITSALNYNVSNNTQVGLQVLYTSSTSFFDQWGTGTNIKLDNYTLLSSQFSSQILKDKLTIFGSVFNIFNTDYREVIGYTTRGRNYKIGLMYTF